MLIGRISRGCLLDGSFEGLESMRKYGLVAAFLAIVMSLSVTAANACQPGCDCANVLPMLENRAEAKRLEDKAHAREVIKQNDNSVGVTCFDRAMMLTARLGGIFSDRAPGGIVPPASESVFGTSSFPDFGAGTKLVKGLDAVVSPTMQGHVGNFTDSLSHALGATIAGYLNNFVSGLIDGFLDDISDAVGDIAGFITTLNTTYNNLQNVMATLGLAMPAVVVTAVASINAAWTIINGALTASITFITNAMTTLVNNIVGMISSALNGLMAAAAPDGECARIAKLWGNGNMPDLTIFPEWRSIVGGAIERGTPYYTIYEMLTGNIPTTPMNGAPGQHLMQELLNAANSSIISNALSDFNTLLSAPGTLPSWQTPPFIPVTATVDAVIAEMNN